VRARYLIDAEPLSKVQGRPFTSEEIEAAVVDLFARMKSATATRAN
jgi:hypothetical protein